MKKLVQGLLGCAGLLVVAIVALVILGTCIGGNKSTTQPESSAQPLSTKAEGAKPTAPTKPTATPMPGIGTPVQTTNFRFTIQQARTSKALGSKTAQGLFLILTVLIENTSNKSQGLNTWDFKLEDAEGRRYDISNEGSTALLFTEPESFWLSATIQPGLSKLVRLVFDAHPEATGVQLEVQGGRRIAIQ